MPNKITFIFFSLVVSVFGLVPNIDIALNHPEIDVKGGEATVNLSNGKSFIVTGFESHVSFVSSDMTFFQSSLQLSDIPLSLYASGSGLNDFATISAFSGGEEYEIRVTKFWHKGLLKIKIIYVAVIPELSTYSLVLGFIVFCLVAVKKRLTI